MTFLVTAIMAVTIALLLGVRKQRPATILKCMAAANLVWVVGIGGMLVATASASKSRLDLLHGQVESTTELASQLGEASENSLIPPLIFGGGLIFVLVVNTVVIIHLVRRLNESTSTGSNQ